ncbi:MAG: DUF2157 domain-containing protein [Actinomycetia bacterium]|nr:DUF2157 domain-containing protein [Actinomycetes bacterium]
MDSWVSEGIISQDQAVSIREYEGRVTSSRGTAAEVLGYVVASTAVVAAIIMVADIWNDVGRGSRFSLLAITAIALLTIGVISASEKEPWVRRFARILMLFAIPLIVLTSEIAASTWIASEFAVVVGYAIAWLTATALYLRWRSSPQQTALFLATIGMVMSITVLVLGNGPRALPGSVLILVSVIWLALVHSRRIEPHLTGEILGSVTALVGSMMLLVGLDVGLSIALLVALAVSAGTVAIGTIRSRPVLTIVGIVALSSYIPWLASETLGPSIGVPFTLVTTLAALALWVTLKTVRK